MKLDFVNCCCKCNRNVHQIKFKSVIIIYIYIYTPPHPLKMRNFATQCFCNNLGWIGAGDVTSCEGPE